MSSDDSNPPGARQQGMGFATVDAISVNNKSPGEILSCILQHEETGTPLVVHGLNGDPNWLPLPGSDSAEEGEILEHQSTGRQTNLSLNIDNLKYLIL